MAEGGSFASTATGAQRRRYNNALRAGYTQNQAVRIANGTLSRR